MARTTSGSFASAKAFTTSFGSLWSKMSSAIREALFSPTRRSINVAKRRLVRENVSYDVPSKPYSARPLVKPTPEASSSRSAFKAATDNRGTLFGPAVANLTPLVIGPVGSALIITNASNTPDMMLYGKDFGLNTRFAALRPTVHADPFTVPRYRRARSACFSISLSPAKNPSPCSSGFSNIEPSVVEIIHPSTSVLSSKNCAAPPCTNSGIKFNPANVYLVVALSLS